MAHKIRIPPGAAWWNKEKADANQGKSSFLLVIFLTVLLKMGGEPRSMRLPGPQALTLTAKNKQED